MGMLQEFKKFAMRGNVVDMAVGIVIGGAFGKIVSSLVEKVITPITAYLTGNSDVSDLVWTLPAAVEGQTAAEIGWGAVAQAILDFIIVAFALFLVIKAMNSMKQKEEAAPTAPPEDILLLREIRDQLAKQ
ncbi:MAG: large conductance mechanosensitive channel protein MscL [Planctomycetaceae bacterium]|nr:large conductance mechanosensitive channel protein MscL [Planctomycetaceae bacterium]